jgi:hypothetical protein
MKKFIKKFAALTTLALLAVCLGGLRGPAKTSAISGNYFQPGNIIADSVFFSPGSMSTQDIQNFLNAKVPTCDTNGTQPYAGTTAAAYGTSRGYPPPYICLKDYSMSVPATSADAFCSGAITAGTKSAAAIIKEVANACSINPEVLIVTLQKEQGLVTDDWPWPIQYRSAMGYGCPDTAACDSQYYGLFNQIYNAAHQFQRYAKQPQLFNYNAGQTSFVAYNPDSGCGGTNVAIQNHATADLYNYTPYQPNAAALADLYGGGDSCSAFGNRNFWRTFWDWFGSPSGVDYGWQFVDVSISKDGSQLPNSTVHGNQSYDVTISALNSGNQSWSNTNYPARLGTFLPTNHQSALYDPSWTSGNRPATLTEATVLPGQIGHFTFKINVPNVGEVYLEHFNLVAEGSTWMQGGDYTLGLNIVKSTYSWQMVSQNSDKSFTLNPSQSASFTLVAKNTGNVTWNNTVKLATWNPSYSRSPFDPGTWGGPYRPATLQEASVAPGQNGTFVFPVRAPSTSGTYNERFNLVMEGVSWFDDPWMEFDVNVGNYYNWQMVSQSSSTGSFALNRGQSASFTLVAKNTGNVTWNNTVKLATWNPSYRTSVFNDGSWSSPYRAATLTEASVAPGQNGTFVINVKAPNTPRLYIERFNLVMEGVSWFTDPWMEFDIPVN